MGLVDGEYWEWPVWEHRTCGGLVTVRKIGKIIVLAEWMGSDGKRKRIVVGPYWCASRVARASIVCASVIARNA